MILVILLLHFILLPLLLSPVEHVHCTAFFLLHLRWLLLLLRGCYWRRPSIWILFAHEQVKFLQLCVLRVSELVAFVLLLLLWFVGHFNIVRACSCGVILVKRLEHLLRCRLTIWLICKAVDSNRFICWSTSKGLTLALCRGQIAYRLDWSRLWASLQRCMKLKLWSALVLRLGPDFYDAIATSRVKQFRRLVCFKDINVIVVGWEAALRLWEAALRYIVESQVLVAGATDERRSIVHHRQGRDNIEVRRL